MNYPYQKNKVLTNYANRGMDLENDLNITNNYYIDCNKAIINKKATPIKVVKVTFDKNKKTTIKEAYFEKPATTDYNGIYKGRYIDFEAKEVQRINRFPLHNINNNQLNHINNIINHGGISFLIVRFRHLNKAFLLNGEQLITFIKENKRKSIPLEYFEKFGYQIKESFRPRLDYLNIIDKLYFKKGTLK